MLKKSFSGPGRRALFVLILHLSENPSFFLIWNSHLPSALSVDHQLR